MSLQVDVAQPAATTVATTMEATKPHFQRKKKNGFHDDSRHDDNVESRKEEVEDEDSCGCDGTNSAAYPCVSNKFLHSDENLLECHESSDDDNDDDEQAAEKRKAAFQQLQQREGEDDNNILHTTTTDDTSTPYRTGSTTRAPHQWANRQLHRSVSMDDLMEYQREFRLEDVGRASSAYDLTDYQREFQAILAEQQHEQSTSTTTAVHPLFQQQQQQPQQPTLATSDPPPSIRSSRRRRNNQARNSIANSDLAEFKRQFFCQERAAMRTNAKMRRTCSADDARRIRDGTLLLSEDDDKLQRVKDSMDYQWGTRSLRRAILGSDLGTFERSVRNSAAALLESSRENSSSSSGGSMEDRSADNNEAAADARAADGVIDVDDLLLLSDDSSNSSSLGVSHRDSQDLKHTIAAMHSHYDDNENDDADHHYAEVQEQEEDWGTRSLRKSLKELDLSDPTTSPSYRPSKQQQRSRIEPVQEEEIELPLDASLSPWKDDKEHPPSCNGLKMPRRVTSAESHSPDTKQQQQQQQKQGEEDCDSNAHESTPTTTIPVPVSVQNRSSSLNDIGILPAGGNPQGGAPGAAGAGNANEPEFEWQLRSRFRRSISSSDIEKYQRHFDGVDEDSERDPDEEADGSSPARRYTTGDCMDDRSAHTVAVVETPPGATGINSTDADTNHPLLSQSPASPWAVGDSRNCDVAPTTPTTTRRRQKRSRRRHRRTTSDEPELHMENILTADVAPRKPTRTTSRPISPPPPRSAVVRFADNKIQVVEIPKVSEDMKPYLFYTKRDVKRFRMNEHRRQEEQIRSYMEYLNEKDNALDASPRIFD